MQTGRLVLSGTLNGSLAGVPAYSSQGVQSCVTEYKLLLCPSLQRAYMDILCAATEDPTMNGGDFSTLAQIADDCGMFASSVGKSEIVCGCGSKCP